MNPFRSLIALLAGLILSVPLPLTFTVPEPTEGLLPPELVDLALERASRHYEGHEMPVLVVSALDTAQTAVEEGLLVVAVTHS